MLERALEDLLSSLPADHVFWTLAPVIHDEACARGLAFPPYEPNKKTSTQDIVMEETTDTVAHHQQPASPPPPTTTLSEADKTKPTTLLNARQGMQEMRAKLPDNLSCDTVLSNGERVGEFLLRQWLGKEATRKSKSKH